MTLGSKVYVRYHLHTSLLFLYSFLHIISVCLLDSVLAFHKHGVQGRSLKNGEITQEITDTSRTYKLLGSDK